MFSKKVKSRIFYSLLILTVVIIIIFLVLKSLRENMIYFFSPTEIYNKPNISLNKKIRVGGLVKERSVNKEETDIIFIITDNCRCHV